MILSIKNIAETFFNYLTYLFIKEAEPKLTFLTQHR